MEEQGSATDALKHTTIAEKMDIAAGLALFPAMTVMVFIRRKLGYRFLNPVRLFSMFLVINVIGALTSISSASSQPSYVTYGREVLPAPAPNPASAAAPFVIFAFAMLITGMAQRWLRWRDIKNSVSWHTYSRGISLFSFLPFNDTIIKRFVDPAVVAIVGLLVMLPFRWLGIYIIVSGFCLLVFEAVDYERMINRMLDVLDSLVESEALSEATSHYTTGQPTEKPIEQTAGIPTGVAPDLAAAIERKRQRQQQQQQQQQPNNLIPV